MPFLDCTIFFTKSEREKSDSEKQNPKLFTTDGHFYYTEWCPKKIEYFSTMNAMNVKKKKLAPGGELSFFFATLRRPARGDDFEMFFN